MKKELIQVGGMTCAACSRRVEKAIGKLDGIEEVVVNFATEKAAVTFDESSCSLEIIKNAIKDAGYKPIEKKEKNSVDEDKIRKEKDITN